MKDQDRNDRESLEEIQAETTVSKNQTEQKQHKRRVRYKGTHPRSYQEKYKELQPEKYPETIEKVIQKGDLGFSPDPAGAERTGCHTGIWWTYKGNVKVSAGTGASICA